MMEIDEVPTLPEDPTIAQMREYREEKKKMNKAKTCIHLALIDEVFTKIMTCKTAKQAWDLLKNEYEGNDRTKRMQVLNLKREFEMQKMKETKSLKDYSKRLKKVVNKIRLLGEELPDDRVVEKILVTLPERFESKISSVEESRDLSEISLADFLHALEAQEQRRTYRNESNIEGAFKAMRKKWRATDKLQLIHTDVCGDVKREKLDPKAEYGVFVGYSNVTKGYRNFQPLTGKLKVCRDVKFDETARKNWDKNEPENIKEESRELLEDERIDDIPVRGYDDAAKDPKWIAAMEEKMIMIEKNKT
nr:uncharacterized protein LOC113737402 [Ipomoea batatas]